MSDSAPDSPEFWKLDLTRLTPAGWLLVLVSCAVVLIVAAVLLGLSSLVWAENRPPRLVAAAAVGCAVAAGGVFFALGTYGLDRWGMRVIRV